MSVEFDSKIESFSGHAPEFTLEPIGGDRCLLHPHRVTCECSKDSRFTVRKACPGIGWGKIAMCPLPLRERLRCAHRIELVPRYDLALRADGYIPILCAAVLFQKRRQNISKS